MKLRLEFSLYTSPVEAAAPTRTGIMRHVGVGWSSDGPERAVPQQSMAARFVVRRWRCPQSNRCGMRTVCGLSAGVETPDSQPKLKQRSVTEL